MLVVLVVLLYSNFINQLAPLDIVATKSAFFSKFELSIMYQCVPFDSEGLKLYPMPKSSLALILFSNAVPISCSSNAELSVGITSTALNEFLISLFNFTTPSVTLNKLVGTPLFVILVIVANSSIVG